MDMPRSVSLIDGGWLEKARQGLVADVRWDLQSFANRLVPRYHWRFRIYYFDALPFKDRNDPSASQQEKYRRKEEELRAIDRTPGPATAKGKNTDERNSGPMPEKDAARERLSRWFLSLTPQERLAFAEEAEEFRREARIAGASGDNESAE